MRVKLMEINFSRIYHAIKRRIITIPDKISWALFSSENSKNLLAYKNKFKGETCFLVANGPSLKKMDLSFLQNYISFGLNRIYLAYDEMNFKNDFLVSINRLVLEQFNSDLLELDMPKFINWESRGLFKNDKNTLFVYKNLFGPKFGKELHKSINPAATVTYAALQIIYYMGFDKVIIIGMDHNFVTKTQNQPNKTEVRSEEKDVNHFHPNYFPRGSKWETPDLVSSEYFYNVAKRVFEQNGRQIIDCTIDGKCEIFEKGDVINYI